MKAPRNRMRTTLLAATVAACLLAALAGASAFAFIQSSSITANGLGAGDDGYRYRSLAVADSSMDRPLGYISSND